jgi:hypothetical protein
MIILNEKPPNFDHICAAFKINPQTTVFTYGDILYNPAGAYISDDTMIHEEVHAKQQKEITPELWWGKFLRDANFRIGQEARAYAVQYRFLCQTHKDRNERVRILVRMAKTLSGPLYGEAIPHGKAFQLINGLAKV